MAQTNVPAGSGIALKHWSKALFAQVGKMPSRIDTLCGPAPTVDGSHNAVRGQTSTGMPLVKVTDLASAAGDTVRVDCEHVIKLRPVMGDQNAEGKGAKLDYSYKDVTLDMATLPVSAGGKMTQKRTQRDLRLAALNQLKGAIPKFRWQRVLTHLCGGRGQQDGVDWILPLASDAEFASMMVNALRAPTYNRHFVVDGSDLKQGGANLGSVDATDKMTLDIIDALSVLISETTQRLLPVQVPGDPVGMDDPIKGILLLDNLVYDAVVTSTATNNIRQWQANALDRAKWGNMGQHPLFAGGPLLWNGVIVRRMGDFAVRWNADGTQAPAHIKAANRYSATESTDVTIPNLTSGGNTYSVCRSVLLGAQALAICDGANTTTGMSYSLLENTTNFGRNREYAGEIMAAEDKLRFSLPDGQGNLEPTDIGVMVIDSVCRNRAT